MSSNTFNEKSMDLYLLSSFKSEDNHGFAGEPNRDRKKFPFGLLVDGISGGPSFRLEMNGEIKVVADNEWTRVVEKERVITSWRVEEPTAVVTFFQ